MFDFKIVKTLEVGKAGGESLYLEDVDNDGEKEIIFRQSAGMLCKSAYKDNEFLSVENGQLLQHTCMKQDGRILWQEGSPWLHEKPYYCHSGKAMTVIADIDNDGIDEVI